MPSRRSYASYNDGCAAAHSLDVVGERWALLVARELLLGPKRFSDLQRDVIGISATALTQRLRELERDGVLTKRATPAPARAPVYQLTAWGQRLESVIRALSVWGAQSSALPHDADMSPDAVVLAMRAHSAGDLEQATDRAVDLRLHDARHDDGLPASYTAARGPSGWSIVKGEGDSAHLQIEADSRTWQHLLFGRTDLRSAIDADGVTLTPDGANTRELVGAMIRAFSPGSMGEPSSGPT